MCIPDVLILTFCSISAFSNDHSGQGKQCQNVWHYHELVEHVGQFPYQVVGQKGAEEHEGDGYDGIGFIPLEELAKKETA